jgi:hypothetical protein
LPKKQVKKYAILLRSLIKDRLGMNLYVNCVIVFTNKDVMLRIDNPTVTVLKPTELCKFIKNHCPEVILKDQELGELEAAIRPYSQFH